MAALARLWRRHPLALTAFVAAAALALFFLGRTVFFIAYWSDPAQRDRAIEGWMTPGYVARSWHVPREVVGAALGLEPGSGQRQTLDQIARARGIPVEQLVAELTAAVAAASDGR